jgi:hypothetical protein
MHEGSLNPLYVFFLYILRCVVPLGIMLGLSYLLRRFGFISKPPPPPKGWDDEEDNSHNNHNPMDGGVAHG